MPPPHALHARGGGPLGFVKPVCKRRADYTRVAAVSCRSQYPPPPPSGRPRACLPASRVVPMQSPRRWRCSHERTCETIRKLDMVSFPSRGGSLCLLLLLHLRQDATALAREENLQGITDWQDPRLQRREGRVSGARVASSLSLAIHRLASTPYNSLFFFTQDS